jgi:hypothetical protein
VQQVGKLSSEKVQKVESKSAGIMYEKWRGNEREKVGKVPRNVPQKT